MVAFKRYVSGSNAIPVSHDRTAKIVRGDAFASCQKERKFDDHVVDVFVARPFRVNDETIVCSQR